MGMLRKMERFLWTQGMLQQTYLKIFDHSPIVRTTQSMGKYSRAFELMEWTV